mmetsp:Transcript_64272/g.75329  ORF Transcript_64272/g.75329 Transcript_64272/m.75329 type:complete len:147 (-) Transcript_64272:101-541(-)
MVDRIDPSGGWCPSPTVVCKPISYRCFSFVRCAGKNEKAKVMQGLKDVYGKTLGTVTAAEYLGIHGIANRLTLGLAENDNRRLKYTQYHSPLKQLIKSLSCDHNLMESRKSFCSIVFHLFRKRKFGQSHRKLHIEIALLVTTTCAR